MPTPTRAIAPEDDLDVWDARDYKEEMEAERAAIAAAKLRVPENVQPAVPATLYLAAPHSPSKATQAAVQSPAQAPAAAPIPMPHRHKTGYYPALASRSALFGVGRANPGGPSLPLADTEARKEYGLECEGPSLSLMDKAVWEAAIDLCKKSGIDAGEDAPISLSEVARRVGWKSTGGQALDSIWDCMERLAAVRIEFNSPAGQRASGNLLASARRLGKAASVSFDPTIAKHLLGHDMQVELDTSRRGSLKGNLAKWIHDFLSTHTTSNPVDLRYSNGTATPECHIKSFDNVKPKTIPRLTGFDENRPPPSLRTRSRAAIELRRNAATSLVVS